MTAISGLAGARSWE